jgi:sugar/nucleoside kinase (ribokinase family)
VVVLIDKDGSRSFLAPAVKTATKFIDADFVRAHRATLEQTDYFVLGYYGRMPLLEPGLPSLLREIQSYGCRTVMDSACDGGDPTQLAKILPHLDIYVPSEAEASQQTKSTYPEKMIQWFRQFNDHGILGVKLGQRGALLHSPNEGLIRLDACPPPKSVVDTTGAGDCFIAGLIAGLDRGLTVAEAGSWATAAGALAVTARGGHQGVSSLTKLQSLL